MKQEENISINIDYINSVLKENVKLKEESKALNFTIDKLESKIDDVHKDLNNLLVPAQERYKAAKYKIGNCEEPVFLNNIVTINYEQLRHILKITAGL